ncbi:MAG: translation elongation factor 4 [Patescibacteria group bacterium]|nr:translation elongation factor 4 [Patescibacteria group bacterium]
MPKLLKMPQKNIRNFVIIAHIDHGKSTLADRMLELTGTIPPHKMRAQYLDQMELERERGITIKMAPVRMRFLDGGREYFLNLIDTPGHSDFSYEVSRALNAVEGAILLVDATQGIQAQTLANYHNAVKAGLRIIGAVNKIDVADKSDADKVVSEVAELLSADANDIFRVSGKTGEGVKELIRAVVDKIPSPKTENGRSALIFSSLYDEHKGVVAFARVFGGEFKSSDETKLVGKNYRFKVKEVGHFSPEFVADDKLIAPEIGYIVTGIKDPEVVLVGDTIGEEEQPGFVVPSPVVFVSVYPEGDDYDSLKSAVYKLKLNDSALSFSPDMSEVLGRGFKGGFLGKLHFEITVERLKREFGIKVITSFPSVAYKVKDKSGEKVVENPRDFPDEYYEAWEPAVNLTILSPQKFLGAVLDLGKLFRMKNISTTMVPGGAQITATMPLADLILDFDDKLKSVSQGFASFSYALAGYEKSDLRRVDILVAEEIVPGLSRIVPKEEAISIGRKTVGKLKELLPRKQFAQALQAAVRGEIVARETIPALRKDVTGYLYGGDRTRKMKLWKKQKEGKARLKSSGRVTVSPEVFKELLKK